MSDHREIYGNTSSINTRQTSQDGSGNVGQGLTATEKNLMLTLFRAVPYTGEVAQAYKSLEAIWNSGDTPDTPDAPDIPDVTYYAISYNLTSVTADNSASSVIAGGSLTVNLSTETNAVLGQVVVTMGGVDVTATAYKNGKISIASVTGDVVITAAAVVANYTQVEYLEATETNGVGILTSYSPASTDLVEIEFTPMLASLWLFPFAWSAQNATCTFTTRVDGVAGRTSFTRRPNGSYASRNDPDPDFALPNVVGARYRLVESPFGTATLYDAEGTAMVTLTDAQANRCIEPSSPVGLFAFYENGVIRGNTSAKGLRIHSFRITDVYGATKLDVIPVLDADGVACMYDKISGDYLYDVSGKNTFIAGGAV